MISSLLNKKVSYGTPIISKNDGHEVVNLGFTFKYCDKTFTQVSISSNGYVCLGVNSLCSSYRRPSPHEILVGLNHDLNPTKIGSGQIYYVRLASDAFEFKLANTYVTVLQTSFLATNIFMITYDDVLIYSNVKASFQIFLIINEVKSFVIFKYKSCPNDATLYSSSGLNHKYGIYLDEFIIANGQQCSSSNVGHKGVWVIEVTTYATGNFYFSL